MDVEVATGVDVYWRVVDKNIVNLFWDRINDITTIILGPVEGEYKSSGMKKCKTETHKWGVSIFIRSVSTTWKSVLYIDAQALTMAAERIVFGNEWTVSRDIKLTIWNQRIETSLRESQNIRALVQCKILDCWKIGAQTSDVGVGDWNTTEKFPIEKL